MTSSDADPKFGSCSVDKLKCSANWGEGTVVKGPGDKPSKAWRTLPRPEVRFPFITFWFRQLELIEGKRNPQGVAEVITLSRTFVSSTAKAKTAKLSAFFFYYHIPFIDFDNS
jgi:hypothetical protein